MACSKEESTDFEVNISSNDFDQETSTMANKKPTANEMYCDPCSRSGKRKETAGFCMNCKISLCSRCFNFHKKSLHHKLLDNASVLKSKTDEKVKDECVDRCPSHLDRVIEYICQSCDELCCSVCIIKSHRKCESVDFIPDIIENIEQSKVFLDLNEAVEVQSVLLAEYEKTCEIDKYKSTKLRDAAKEDVRLKCQEVHKWLTEKEKEMIGKIENKYSEEQQRVGVILAEVKILKGDIETVKSNISTKTGLSQRCQLFVAIQKAKLAANKRQKRLQELDKVETVETYRFKEAVFIDNIKNNTELGTIETVSSEKDRNIKFLYSIDTREGYPGTMCIICDNLLLLKEQYLTTLRLNPGKKESQILYELHLDSMPADITNISDTQVAVTFPYDGVIKFFDVTSTGNVSETKTIQVGKNCRAIQYFKNSFIVSYCHNKSGSISIIDMSGQLIKEIAESSKLMLQRPTSLALNLRTEILYVADPGYDTVTSLTLDGIVINQSEYLPFAACGIDSDENGSIYACSGCVGDLIQLSDNCIFIKRYEGEQNTWYGNMCIVISEKNDFMYVSSNRNRINVFEIL